MSSIGLFICKATLLCFCSIIISLFFVETSQSADSVSDSGNQEFTETGIGEIVKNDFSTESLWFGFDESVTVASKIEEKVKKAPSIVTVITSEEIENMGVRKLVEVLRTVPGFDILKSALSGAENISARGIRTIDVGNEKIRILLDGHYITWHNTGNASLFFDDLPLKNVKRIEIIRGPGSALYGANAFHGVINIITKDADDVKGVEVSSGFGSYDTQEYNIMYGESFHGINFTGFADFYNTNGLSETIKTDAFSSLPFYNRFSIAPNDSDDSRNKFDIYLKTKYKDIELNAKYMNKDSEPFVNATGIPVLTNGTEQDTNYVMADLKYKLQLGERLTLKPRVYYDQNDWKLDFQANPEGFTVPVDIDGDGDIERFPKGQRGIAKYSNRNLGAEIQADYDLLDNNVFTLGFKYDWIKQTNINVSSNFDPFTGAETGSMQNINNAEVIPEFTRQIWAIYFQDKWDITDDMGFTFGVRHDHYSDFEGTTNPRLGFVWNFLDNATLKLLYGQAFRAPDFSEMFTNNIFAESDIRVDPETIRTYEIGLGYRFGDNISVNTNYFFNVVRDLISASSASESGGISTFGNIGDANI